MTNAPSGLSVYTGPWDFEDTSIYQFSGSQSGATDLSSSINLGNLRDFDLEFEINADINHSSNAWFLCNGPYVDADGILLGLWDAGGYEGIAVAGGAIGGYGNTPYANVPHNTWTKIQIQARLDSLGTIEIFQNNSSIGTQTGISPHSINWNYLYIGRGSSQGTKASPTWGNDGLNGFLKNIRIANRLVNTNIGHPAAGGTFTAGNKWFSPNYYGVDTGSHFTLGPNTDIGNMVASYRVNYTGNSTFWVLLFEHTGGTINTNTQQFTIRAGYRIDTANGQDGNTRTQTVTMNNQANLGQSSNVVPSNKTYYLGWFSGAGGAGYNNAGTMYVDSTTASSASSFSRIHYSASSSTSAPQLNDTIAMPNADQASYLQLGLI